MRASLGRFGEVLWWLVLAGELAGGGMVAVLLMSVIPLSFVGIVWLHEDALFKRRFPWVSWPVMVAFDVGFGWLLVRIQCDAMRQRRELPGKIGARALRCPLCDGPLP